MDSSKNFKNYIQSVYEASQYPIYHNSYSSAIQAAEDFALKNNYSVDKEEWAQDIGLGPVKPKEGKTNKFSMSLYKGEKKDKKKLHIQVYNRGTASNEFELNMYIS